mmetsp:Transcript_12266/g.24333  ORF Transcript_12266/g.24333 Transcript_12266/m.24333 type:complete len:487 (-) Transcript_12266:25-1485(-)
MVDESEARAAFEELDPASLGKIESSELPLLLSALNMPLTAPLDELEAELDREGNGLILLQDFVAYACKPLEPIQTHPLETESAASSNLDDLDTDGLYDKITKATNDAKSISSSDIHEAAWNGDIDLVAKYVKIDPSLAYSIDDTEFGCGYRPLHYAAYNGHDEVCKFLLDDSAVNLNCTTSNNCTALFLAAQQGHSSTVQLLLSQGADPTVAEDEYNYTPIDVSRQFKRTVYSIFKSGEEWEYEKWRNVPQKLGAPRSSNAKGNSFEIVLPELNEDEGVLRVREFKIKVVELPSGKIVDLIIVPRSEWGGEQEETVIVRNLSPGCSFAAYVSGINGIGYGEYSDMSNVVSTKARPSKKAPASAGRSPAPVSAPAPAPLEKKAPKKVKKVKKKTDAPVPAPLTATAPAPLSAKKSRTLQPVVAGEAGKPAKKGKAPKAITLPVASPTKHQMPSDSDESSEGLDFNLLPPDASETASEEESNENEPRH